MQALYAYMVLKQIMFYHGIQEKKVLYEFKLINLAFPNFSKYCQLYIQYHQTLINWRADLISPNLDLEFSCNLCREINKLLKVGLV